VFPEADVYALGPCSEVSVFIKPGFGSYPADLAVHNQTSYMLWSLCCHVSFMPGQHD
jgi:hypothetical protein